MAGRLLFLLVVGALGLGFVGWLATDPSAPMDAETQDKPLPDSSRVPLELQEESSPALEVDGRAPTRPASPRRRGSTPMDARIQALAKKVSDARGTDIASFHRDRNVVLPWLATSDSETLRWVRADPAAWRAHVATIAGRLAGAVGIPGAPARAPIAQLHVLISVLEALVPLDEAAVRVMSGNAYLWHSWRLWGIGDLSRRLVEVVASSVGDAKFLDLVLGAPTAGRPESLSWPMDEATARVLARIAAKDATTAARIRQQLFDKAARGGMSHVRGGERSIARVVAVVFPNDSVVSMGPFPRPNTQANALGADRRAFETSLYDPHPYIRIHAIDALQGDGVTAPSMLRGPLLTTFLAKEPRIRAKAIRLAPFILQGVDEFIPTLNEMLATDDPALAADAASALVRLAPLRGDADMSRLLGRILGRAEADVRVRLLKDMTQFGMLPRDEADLLAQYLGDASAAVRLAVVASLGDLALANASLEDVPDLLARAKRDKDKRVAELAAAWFEEVQGARNVTEDNRKPFAGRAEEAR